MKIPIAALLLRPEMEEGEEVFFQAEDQCIKCCSSNSTPISIEVWLVISCEELISQRVIVPLQ